MLKEFIEIAEKAVYCKKNTLWHSYEGNRYMFMKTIIEYVKMDYDNIILGYFC